MQSLTYDCEYDHDTEEDKDEVGQLIDGHSSLSSSHQSLPKNSKGNA